ncbi:family 10 glycosylhydrolase [Fulvivirgaceae bacterium PWU4]|uniref:Family 10 glycosylhydrolase n=1 Tax=Chryseosolibacter histidini TaxID=2782349 RepID=A0AAP2DM29_9BACT|nr:family 10 glycosylhydrolase [Chryseosolibacter histidini]MBT1697637.1 family 10 glycosylhydrolase [Chryseosolibacter histidini]
MRKRLPVFLALILMSFCGFAQAPKREMRGAWIATYANIDWPNRSQPPALQRAAFISIVDHHKATGMNTLFIQIRSQCDAMYPSAIEPWSADLTGTQGKAPVDVSLVDGATTVWDPLQFMIDECHKRGIEFHAWINPYRAVANYNQINSFAATHVAKQHPEWLLTQGTLRVLDPGLPAVRNYITSVVVDIVNRYDVDGIHFDDYFYPPAAGAGVTPYNDDATFAADPRGFTVRGDWRRDNVNILIRGLNDTIQSVKPWVKFGVSPSGIYRNSTNPAIGTPTSGLEHYTTLFADSRRWIQEGWVDYIAPQVYWYIGQPGANYSVIVPWWNNNAYGRHIYIGMAGYKVNDPAQGANWANPSMIPNEVRMNRSTAYPNIYGQSIYNTSSLRSSSKLGFRDSLRLNFYKKPALLPAMPWRDNMAPEPPTLLAGVQYGSDSVVLTWTKPADALNELDKAKKFVIYRGENPVIDITRAENIVAITSTDVATFKDVALPSDTTYYYTVTSLDRFHNESVPSNVTDYAAPAIACGGSQQLNADLVCAAVLPDYTNLAVVSDDVSPVHEIIVTQSPEAGTVVNGLENAVVTLTATDASGKSSSCSFVVEIKDVTPPVVSAVEDIIAQTGEGHTTCEQVVTWTEPVATDNCAETLAYFSRSHAPGSSFPVGTTAVTYVFKDASGNESTRSFNVTVVDDTEPVIVTKNISRALANGTLTITAADVNNGSWDNCGIDAGSLSVYPNTFDCTNIGANTVTLIAADVHGNTHSATAVVTVTGAVPQLGITLAKSDNTYTGLPANTLALGYGAQKLTLIASNSTPSQGTAYVWTPAEGLSNTNAAATVFTPAAEGHYEFTVTATNSFGCAASASTEVEVIDVRCGNRNNKVEVCLELWRHTTQLCVSPLAAKVLLKTGATLGACDPAFSFAADDETNARTAVEEDAAVLSGFPNPFTHAAVVQFQLPKAEQNVFLELYDVFGNRLGRLYEGGAEAGRTYTFTVDAEGIAGRFFVARLVTSREVYNFKMVRKE